MIETVSGANDPSDPTAREAPAAGDPVLRRPRAVSFLLAALGHESRRRLTELLAPLGLGPRDMALMRLIADSQGLSQRELSRRLGIPPSRMVALLDDLGARELVERRAHPRDRRVHAVHPTARGERLLSRADALGQEHEARMCADLSPAEREQLLALLERMATALKLPDAVHPALAERRKEGRGSTSTTDRREGR